MNTNWGADLSPNGEKLAFYSLRPHETLVIRSLKTGQERVFPIDFGTIAGSYFQGPEWFADGNSVLLWAGQAQRPEPIPFRINATTGDAEELAGLGTGFLWRVSPDGTSIFYRAGPARRLVRFDLETATETTVTTAPQPAGITDLALSADGKQLAYNLQGGQLGEGTRLMVMPSAGGKAREVFRDRGWGLPVGSRGQRFNALGWTSDQRHLLFVKVEMDEGQSSLCGATGSEACFSIWRVPVDGGEAESIGASMRAQIQSLQAHPDGRGLFFSTVGIHDQIWALENFLPSQTASR